MLSFYKIFGEKTRTVESLEKFFFNDSFSLSKDNGLSDCTEDAIRSLYVLTH